MSTKPVATTVTIGDLRRIGPAVRLTMLRFNRKLLVARHRCELADVDRQITKARAKLRELDGEAAS